MQGSSGLDSQSVSSSEMPAATSCTVFESCAFCSSVAPLASRTAPRLSGSAVSVGEASEDVEEDEAEVVVEGGVEVESVPVSVVFAGTVRVDEDQGAELVKVLVALPVFVLFAGTVRVDEDQDAVEPVEVLIELLAPLTVFVAFAGMDIVVDQEAEEAVEVTFTGTDMVEDHDTEDSVEVLSAPPLPVLLLGMETVGADDEDERLVELLVIAPVSVLF
jgi:hypothetical protein